MAHAAKHPDRDFIGIERLLMRLRRLGKKIDRAGLTNVRLLRIESAYALQHLLPPHRVSVFYIFFPDPWPKRRHHPRRLVSAAFVKLVAWSLAPGGTVHAATDHADYGEHIRRCFTANPDFELAPTFVPPEDERTDFELEFLAKGATITRCSYRLKAAVAGRDGAVAGATANLAAAAPQPSRTP